MAIYSPPLPRSVGRELPKADAGSLEFEDIQHFLIYRSPALAARYEFLTFREPAAGRAWLRAMTEKVTTAAAVRSGQLDTRWVTVALSWNGIGALGLDDQSLASLGTWPINLHLSQIEPTLQLGASKQRAVRDLASQPWPLR
jgi:hypothetical protein